MTSHVLRRCCPGHPRTLCPWRVADVWMVRHIGGSRRLRQPNHSPEKGLRTIAPCPCAAIQARLRIRGIPRPYMTTVAIIENNNAMRKKLVELIDREAGFRCICECSNSKEALVKVPKHWPHIALMDIHLPDESGIVCTARLTEKMPDL